MKNKKTLILLAAILILGFFLRGYRLAANPPALNWDEVSHGYNAYSIWRTGRDEWDQFLPLIFRAYGDYKLPVYIYLTAPIAGFLGLNAVSVRLVSVLAGGGLVLIFYFLGRVLWPQKKWALWLAFLAAVSPWSIFISRAAIEANLALFFFTAALWFWQRREAAGAIIFLGLAMETYNAARVVVPLVFLYILLDALRHRRWWSSAKMAFLMLLVSLPFILQIVNKTGEARFFWTTPVDQGAINRIIWQRQHARYPFLARWRYNRFTYFGQYVASHYYQHFGLNFLFLRGGTNYQFSLPDHGLIFLVLAPFFWLGGLLFLRQKKWSWLFLLLVAFLPSAITRDSPHVLRSILALPIILVMVVTGLRATKIWLEQHSGLGGRFFLFSLVVAILIQLGFWWRDYWRIYRPAYSWAWQYGYQPAVSYVKQHYGEYGQIIFTKKYGEPHEFVLFYWPWEPSYYQYDPHKKWNYHAHWYWVDAFDKFQFWNDWEIKEKLKLKLKSKGVKSKSEDRKLLLITSPGNWLEGGRLLKTINFLDGSPAFDIIEY